MSGLDLLLEKMLLPILNYATGNTTKAGMTLNCIYRAPCAWASSLTEQKNPSIQARCIVVAGNEPSA